jgi:hypothetical protein
MNIRKTQRKNKTKQVISWPSTDTYFTIEGLIASNQHMLTSSGSDITLRVRLTRAIGENAVAEIGQRNSGKGRPQKIYSMRPVKQSAIDKAIAEGASIDVPRIMPIMEITPSIQTQIVNPVVTPVTELTTTTVQ